jgi:cytochrome c oxidase subunit IV
VAHSHDHHDDAHDEHDDAHDHGIAHVQPKRMLLTIWAILCVLTIFTVTATRIDMGPSGNLGLAMAIAVIKATLVCMFFMHLRYDRLFHSVLLIGGILAGSLFVGFTLMDSSQYQETNIWNPDSPPVAPNGPRPIVSQ